MFCNFTYKKEGEIGCSLFIVAGTRPRCYLEIVSWVSLVSLTAQVALSIRSSISKAASFSVAFDPVSSSWQKEVLPKCHRWCWAKEYFSAICTDLGFAVGSLLLFFFLNAGGDIRAHSRNIHFVPWKNERKWSLLILLSSLSSGAVPGSFVRSCPGTKQRYLLARKYFPAAFLLWIPLKVISSKSIKFMYTLKMYAESEKKQLTGRHFSPSISDL